MPALAEDEAVEAEQPAAEQTQEIPAEVLALLGDTRQASELSDDELKQRFKQARGFLKMKGLTDDTKQSLQAMAQQDRAELASREQAASQQQKTAEPEQAQEKTVQEPVVEEAAIPQEVQALLNDARPTSELSDEELKQRFSSARQFAKMDGLPKDVKQSLQGLAKQARAEMAARETAAKKQPSATEETQSQSEVEQEKPADKALIGTQVPDDVLAFVKDGRQASELSDDELLARVKTARKFSQNNELPEDTRSELENILKAARAEALVRGQADKQPAGEGETETKTGSETGQTEETVAAVPVDQKQVQALDGNQANPEDEAKAKAFLDDPVPADKLSDADLSARLNGIRDLMAGNQLSRETERALRKKLKTERDILRNRVAQVEETKAEQASGTGGKKSKSKDNNFNITIVLGDRRPSDDLDDIELRRRIDIYRDAAFDEQYEEEEREWWRRTMERDRRVLRQRLIEERRRRAERLRQPGINIELGLYFEPGRRPPRDVFAAEVDDEELEYVLVAPPRRKIQRRYTVEEVESSPELRDALPRIEIDTVHFGFGEAFVREEEVENLDRIAGIIEKILAAHPREVFFVEGHTDAVGSDYANLNLSRQRAKAIKQALTTYYVIPAANIKTVGYGERFLKIPTAEAEAENRRVSVARATSLVGELDE
ncbi:MAG: OmpA family protein [Aestuariivirga sp.]